MFSYETIGKLAMNFYFLALVGSSLQVAFTSFSTGFHSTSTILGALSLAGLIAAPMFLFRKFSQSQNFDPHLKKQFEHKYEGILGDFKPEKMINQNFSIFILVEKAMFGLSLVCLWRWPWVQILGVAMGKVILAYLR
jgi:hypothetical protein